MIQACTAHTPESERASQKKQELIVLVHGLMRTSLSMWPLKHYLEHQGYHTYLYSYPSAKYSIHQHAVSLHEFINHLLGNNPNIKIHFITHSLGGIITREALALLSKKQLKNIGCLIMLAPPNQGSKLAKLSLSLVPLLTDSIKPLAELSSEHSSYVHQVPIPKVKMRIIAGRYDAKVPPDAAFLAGVSDPLIVNSNHTFIMNNGKTKQLIISFLNGFE
jgi:pimeloyl-ACP methyl ester carboxylesterase